MENLLKYWLGVVSVVSVYENINNGTHNWFCIDSECQIGDQFYLYATSSTFKKSGIFGLFEITNIDSSQNSKCASYASAVARFANPKIYTEFKTISIYDSPISNTELKTNPITSRCQPVRRLFRGTCFSLGKSEHLEIMKLLKLKNINS